jgi:hypothetical protein
VQRFIFLEIETVGAWMGLAIEGRAVRHIDGSQNSTRRIAQVGVSIMKGQAMVERAASLLEWDYNRIAILELCTFYIVKDVLGLDEINTSQLPGLVRARDEHHASIVLVYIMHRDPDG